MTDPARTVVTANWTQWQQPNWTQLTDPGDGIDEGEGQPSPVDGPALLDNPV